MTLLCVFLVVALATVLVRQRHQVEIARLEGEQTQREAEQALARASSQRPPTELEEGQLSRQRQEEMQTARWRDREKEFQAQLREVEKAASLARRQRDEQMAQRKLTEELMQTADQVRQQAIHSRAELVEKLVSLHVGNGTQRMEEGDLAASLLWLAQALRLAESEKLPTETHRLRLAAVLAQTPRPVQLWIQDKKVNAVQLSADGKRVLFGSANGALDVRERATGKAIGERLPHAEAITHAVFSPDGKRVLTTASDLSLHLWDIEKGQEVFSDPQLPGPVVVLAFSEDGKRFVLLTDRAEMGATEPELHIRDAQTGEAIGTGPIGSEISPLSACLHRDGKQVLTICKDSCARIWDIATNKQIGPAFSHSQPLVHASYSSDGERILTASTDGTARVWGAKTGHPQTPLLKHGGTLRGACFSRDGSHVLTFGEDHCVRVWKARDGDSVGPGIRVRGLVQAAFFSPDGRHVLTTAADGTARLWDYRTGQEVLPPLWHQEPIRYAAFTPGGDALFTLAGQGVRLWDLTAGELPTPPAPPQNSGLVVFSSEGKYVLRATDKAVRVYETRTNEPVGGTLPHTHKVTFAAFSVDGKSLLTVTHQPNGDEQEGHIRVWQTTTGQLLGEPLVHPRAVLEASFSSDGRRVLTACQDGKARLWDVEKSALVGEPMEQKEELRRALFVPDGKRLLTVDAEGGVRLWDTETAEAVGPTWGHRQPIHHLTFSPDGKQLAAACEDGTASIWEASTGQEISSTASESAPVLHVAFSPDGKLIVTVNAAQSARVWDAVTGKPKSPSLRHPSALVFATFSEDGKRIVTSATDGVRLWDARSGEPLSPLLRRGAEQPPIQAVTLHRDGRLDLTTSSMFDPSSSWSVDLRPDERPAKELLNLVEMLSGHRLADTGKMIPLDPGELFKKWQTVPSKSGSSLAPSPARRDSWHRRGASECEQHQLWEGMLQHLDCLLAGGVSKELAARRGRADLALKRWQAARADYTQALDVNKERWELWAGRAESEAALRRWAEALADYTQAIELKGDRADLWTARGRIEAEQGNWRKAAADLGKAIHHGEQDLSVWRQYILLLLASGDVANYRRWCGRFVERVGERVDVETTRSLIKVCTLGEGSLRDWTPLIQRAEQIVAADRRSMEARRQLAMLLHRAGQMDPALKRMLEVVSAPDFKPKAEDELLLALAAHRLGRDEEAKKWLEQAEQLHHTRTKKDEESWEDRLVYETLHREAEALVKR